MFLLLFIVCEATCFDLLIRSSSGVLTVESKDAIHVYRYTMFQWHAIPRGVYGWQSVSGRGFCPVTSITPCQYQSSDGPYSFFYHRRFMTSAIYSVVTLHTPSVVPVFRVLEVTLLKCVFLCLVRQRKGSFFRRLTSLIDRSFLGGST